MLSLLLQLTKQAWHLWAVLLKVTHVAGKISVSASFSGQEGVTVLTMDLLLTTHSALNRVRKPTYSTGYTHSAGAFGIMEELK